MSFNGNGYPETEGFDITNKGSIHTSSGSGNTAQAVSGNNGYVLSENSSQANGLEWIANPAEVGFDNSAKGDIHTYSTTQTALSVGANLKSLYANSATTTGLEWNTNARETLSGTGDILYSSSANTLARLGAGSDGEVLTLASGLPSWATASSGAFERIANVSQTGGSSQMNITSLTNTGDFVYFQAILKCGASDEIRLRLGVSGSIDTGSNYDYEQTSNGATTTTTTGTSFIVCNNGSSTLPTYISGSMTLDASDSGSGVGNRRGYMITRRTSEQEIITFQWTNSTSPLTDIRFYANTGNDILGEFNLWAGST